MPTRCPRTYLQRHPPKISTSNLSGTTQFFFDRFALEVKHIFSEENAKGNTIFRRRVRESGTERERRKGSDCLLFPLKVSPETGQCSSSCLHYSLLSCHDGKEIPYLPTELTIVKRRVLSPAGAQFAHRAATQGITPPWVSTQRTNGYRENVTAKSIINKTYKKHSTISVTEIRLESGAREETGRFRDVKRCVATEDRTRVSGMGLLRHNR